MKHSSICHAAVLCLSLATATVVWGDSPAGAPERLGEVSFPNSCQASVQPKFTRAVALLHSFWFAEGERAFREVLAQDAGCAIANWGIAAILIGNTFAGNATPDEAKRAQEAIDRGRATTTATERERMYIDAVAAYWQDYASKPHGERMKSLATGFEQVAKRYPQDDEASIFSAIYLTATQAPTDASFAATLKAAAILEPLFARHPEHPGVAHYLIHSYDYPPIAVKGLNAAKRYSEIAPSAPHALHMPSHIFTRVGAWQDSVTTNRRSANSARVDKSPGDWLHALDYMAYAYLQLARDRDAANVIEEAGGVSGLNPANMVIGYALAAMPARYAIERGMWKEAALLVPRNSRFAFADAITWFAKSIGAARSGDLPVAEQSARELGEIAQALKATRNEYWANEVEVQHQAARAWISFARGDRDVALAQMRAAAELEDASEKSPVSPGRLVPARELLGDMLVLNGNAAEALVAYERSQVRDPNRLRSLLGAGLAAAQSGNRDKARYFYARAAQLGGSPDARPELRQASNYLASN